MPPPAVRPDAPADGPAEAFGGTETAKSPKTPNSVDLKLISPPVDTNMFMHFRKFLRRKPSCDVWIVKAMYGKWIAMRRRSRHPAYMKQEWVALA